MDEASEEVAVQLAAQGVIGKRVDQMESGFMMALDYMIQIAEQDQDDQVVKSEDLSSLHCCRNCFSYTIFSNNHPNRRMRTLGRPVEVLVFCIDNLADQQSHVWQFIWIS